MLECVVNVSEGRRGTAGGGALDAIAGAAGRALLDLHADVDHHRAVLTLAGPDEVLEPAVRDVARRAVERLDLREHGGAHPRFGVLDVVPFADLRSPRETTSDAIAARDRFVEWAAAELGLPCFRYGPERSLPDVRRLAFTTLPPDAGPERPHPSAGAVAAGARPVLVAWNVWLDPAIGMARGREVATALRAPAVRALCFELRGQPQLSFNLVDPLAVGPADVWDAIVGALTDAAALQRAELVGLVPEALLAATPQTRWASLDLAPDRTIESRLAASGLTG